MTKYVQKTGLALDRILQEDTRGSLSVLGHDEAVDDVPQLCWETKKAFSHGLRLVSAAADRGGLDYRMVDYGHEEAVDQFQQLR